MVLIKRALVSVFNKDGIVEFARVLSSFGVEIISSGGTAKLLANAGVKVKSVSDFTGFPEMMDGRIKTLHPKIHAGILANRKKKEHLEEAKRNNIELIDLVVVNLYPFEETISKKNVSLEEVIENIDIGGPTLLRSAAKNFDSVVVVCNPKNYSLIIEELKNTGTVSEKTRKQLALEAWEHVAHYDVVIENYFRKLFGENDKYPNYLNLSFQKLRDLRYGENHHQTAALYVEQHVDCESIVTAKILKEGKLLSYNNILDGNAAVELIKEFDEPTAVIIKHNNPSGVASSHNIVDAYKTARAVDPEAAFGGVVAVNRKVEKELANEIMKTFVEVVIAPAYSKEAEEILGERKNIRLLEIVGLEKKEKKREPYLEYRSVVGGLLVQDADVKLFADGLRVVTKRKPTENEMKAMLYAWKIVKYVKSNAIVFAKENRAVGIGAGQMKRVDAAKLAAMIANDYSGPDSLKGCAMASDAFFPFRDGIDFAAKLGVTAIIQPGGSIKDAEVIKAADEHNIAMVFTGTRHFKH
jgi:phosphoribosylaminoimidazolecarboxamide formyltransferase/IMP cyclohydrolase